MIWSNIKTDEPLNPITFTRKDAKAQDGRAGAATLGQIIQEVAPEFREDHTFVVNPLLASGHLQTAYTALRKFDTIDCVQYGRRLLQVDPDDGGYTVDGEKLKFDRFKGESTFALDIVLNTTKPSDNVSAASSNLDPVCKTEATSTVKSTSQGEVPASQDALQLPPRTSYISHEEERAILGDNSKPLLIALHGLSGGSYEAYVRAMLNEITSNYGFDAAVINSRGCAGHTPTTPQLFNGLWTNDVRYLINVYMAKHYPQRKIFLVGFSLGGAILANFLGQEYETVSPNILGATVVGTPWDFMDSNICLDSFYLGNRIYSPTMSQNLQRLLKSHESVMKGEPNVAEFFKHQDLYNLEKLHDFDEAFTAKFFGFNNHREYYRLASPVLRLNRIRVPTLIICSNDDPITGNRTFPFLEVRDNPYSYMVTTSIGGHLGWFKINGERWYPKPISKVFKEIFTNWKVNGADPSNLPKPEEKFWRHHRLVV